MRGNEVRHCRGIDDTQAVNPVNAHLGNQHRPGSVPIGHVHAGWLTVRSVLRI